MVPEDKSKDLCKTCEHFWLDFQLPLDHVESHCDIIDSKYGLNKGMNDIVPYPCLKCPFNSYKKKL